MSPTKNWLVTYGLQPMWPRSPFVGSDFLLKFWFWSHNFRSRNANEPIKGSNDMNYSLVSNKTLSQKTGHWFDSQGLMTSTKMCEPTPIMTSPTKKTKPNLSTFWKNMNYKTSRIFKGFEQLSNSISWRVMIVQSSAKMVNVGLKGLSNIRDSPDKTTCLCHIYMVVILRACFFFRWNISVIFCYDILATKTFQSFVSQLY